MSIQEQTPQIDEGSVIALTDSAISKVKELIAAESEENLALRVAVRPGGCSGFSYEMFFDTDVADDDGTLSPAQVRRFHDRYRAFGAVAETGYVFKPWARQLLLRLYGTHFDQDVQHNANMTVPYGEVATAQTALGASLRYELHNVAGSPLDLKTVAAYGHRIIGFEGDLNQFAVLPILTASAHQSSNAQI